MDSHMDRTQRPQPGRNAQNPQSMEKQHAQTYIGTTRRFYSREHERRCGMAERRFLRFAGIRLEISQLPPAQSDRTDVLGNR